MSRDNDQRQEQITDAIVRAIKDKDFYFDGEIVDYPEQVEIYIADGVTIYLNLAFDPWIEELDEEDP